MTVKMKDGFKVNVKEERLNDWNVLVLLRNIDKGDAGLIVDVVDAILGSEQAEKLAKHLEVKGITPIDSMVDAISEIIELSKELKNS